MLSPSARLYTPTILSVEKDSRSGTQVNIDVTANYSDNSSVLFPPNIVSIIGFQYQKTGPTALLGTVTLTPDRTPIYRFQTEPLPNATYVFMARRNIDGVNYDSILSDPVTISNSPGSYPSIMPSTGSGGNYTPQIVDKWIGPFQNLPNVVQMIGTALYSEEPNKIENTLTIYGLDLYSSQEINFGSTTISQNTNMWNFVTPPLPDGTYSFYAKRMVNNQSVSSNTSKTITIQMSSPTPSSLPPKIPPLFYGVLTLEVITLIVLFFVPNSDFCKNNRIPCATFLGLWFCLLLIVNSILASQIHSLNEMQKGLIGSFIAITYLSCIVLLVVVIYQLYSLYQNSSPRSQRRSGVIQMGGGGRGYTSVLQQGQR